MSYIILGFFHWQHLLSQTHLQGMYTFVDNMTYSGQHTTLHTLPLQYIALPDTIVFVRTLSCYRIISLDCTFVMAIRFPSWGWGVNHLRSAKIPDLHFTFTLKIATSGNPLCFPNCYCFCRFVSYWVVTRYWQCVYRSHL